MNKETIHSDEVRSNIPLVRLQLIQPFIDELDRRNINADAVLAANGLVRSSVADPDVFVPNIVTHRFADDAAAAAGDPYLGVRVGERIDMSKWIPRVGTYSSVTSVGEYLVRIVMAAKEEATSARHELEVHEEYTFFREVRVGNQETAPAQADSVVAAYLLNLIKKAVDNLWDGKKVLVKVYDPDVIPVRYLGTEVIGGDKKGVFVRFPTEWIFQTFDVNTLVKPLSELDNRLQVPEEFLAALRSVIYQELENGELRANKISELIGISNQSLQRKLKLCGTTVSAELQHARKEKAINLLTKTAKSVSDIASAVGFSNPANFTRAFKSWTGQSPRQYREENL